MPGDDERSRMVERLVVVAEPIMGSIGNAGRYVADEIAAGKNVLFEGAQGALLDVDHGTYPYVTSSTTTAAGACSVGVGPTSIDAVVGITKAYCTRVGAGPFPTEMEDDTGAAWREAGAEFGATTGRPRRCGWLDLAALKTAVRINGITSLAVTKLDIATNRGPLRVGVGYETPSGETDELPTEVDRHVRPVFRELAGWNDDLTAARSLVDLPRAARAYIDAITEHLEIPVSVVSVGPKRTETIVLSRPFSGRG